MIVSKMKWIILSFFILFAVKSNASKVLADCGITSVGSDLETTFVFHDVKENHKVGSLLANYTVMNVNSATLKNENDTFVKLEYNKEEEQIQFYLKQPLTLYREREWKPSMEIEFSLYCKSLARANSDGIRNFNFMLITIDDNLYGPTFDVSFPNPNLTIPWQPVIHNNYEESLAELLVTDIDYNPENANVSIACKGDDCKYFRIDSTLKSNISRGYKYEVNVFLEETEFSYLEVDTNLSIIIEANDSLHAEVTQLNFTATRLASGQGPTEESKLPLGAIAGGGAGILLVGLLFAAAFGYTSWKSKKTKDLLKKMTEAEIREFLDGTAGFSGNNQGPKRSVDVNTPILSMPYNKDFEIARDKLRIDETTILGTGFFGIVMKGSIIRPNGDSVTVAVKAVKRNVGVLYFKALLSEIKIMAHIGRHANIVSLMGACTHNIRKREVFIAVEFCSNGNLHNYLRSYRTSFINLVRDGKLYAFSINKTNYTTARKASLSSLSYSKQISTLNLVKWSTQIAHGLEYLSSLGVIHGDLATRNILLDSSEVCKIADFGLSRRLVDYSSYYYTKQSQAPLPWKWMAPESLKDMKFSKYSDIWSFGIVLWEIFTLGQTPYPGLNWDEKFVGRLEGGLRLTQPQYAPNEIYEIMQDCWTLTRHRPVAFDIRGILENITTALINQKSDEEYFKVMSEEKFIYIGEKGEKADVNMESEDAEHEEC